MNPCLSGRRVGLLVLAMLLSVVPCPVGAAPPSAKAKGPSAEALEFSAWKVRMLVARGNESLKVSEVREDPEKVNGGACVAFDIDGETVSDGYPLLLGKLDGPTDMSGHHAVAFSYKFLVKTADKAPNLQFELHEAGGQKGAVFGTAGIVMDENWQEVEVPLAKLREAFHWDLSNVGEIGLAPRFPANVRLSLTLKFAGFRLVK